MTTKITTAIMKYNNNDNNIRQQLVWIPLLLNRDIILKSYNSNNYYNNDSNYNYNNNNNNNNNNYNNNNKNNTDNE